MAQLMLCKYGCQPPPNSGIVGHRDSRRVWPGCDDALGEPYALARGARTNGVVSWRLHPHVPTIDDHIVGNHVIQSISERRKKNCGCIDRFGCACSCTYNHTARQDAPGCKPPHRKKFELRRIVGNVMVDHTNDMCSMRNSQTCTRGRRRGHGPHTFSYRNSNSSGLAERDYDLNFWKDELLRELDMLEVVARELQDRTCEAEDAFEETELPLAVAAECQARHHGRFDNDGLQTDEVEETLQEEKKNLYGWREKLDHMIENAHAQIRRNCELGVVLTTDHKTRHQTMRVDCHTHEFNTNPARRPVVPETWSNSVKEHCFMARVEREKTKKMCADLQRLMRESSNEIWQFSRVSTNALRAHIKRMHRDKADYAADLAKVDRDILELERVMLMMQRSIRDQEINVRKATMRIDERARHLNTEVCSDKMLADMKKDQRDTCEQIKLTQTKLAGNRERCAALRARRQVIVDQLAVRQHDLQTDTETCLPMRERLDINTRGGPIVKIPHVMKHLRHGSALDY